MNTRVEEQPLYEHKRWEQHYMNMRGGITLYEHKVGTTLYEHGGGMTLYEHDGRNDIV